MTQDCRGRFDSEGTFTPFVTEADDAADTLAWIAEQPWSNGRVAMLGGSYVGATQWLAAGLAPRDLVAIAPYVTASDYHEGWVYQGGAFLRLRYRRSLAEPVLLEPGTVEEVRILVGSTANRFLAGHRIRIDISSSNFPRFDANTNSGGVIASDGVEDFVPAVNRVFHDSARPSHVLLPIVERA